MANGRFVQGERVGVLTTQPLDMTLDYLAPEGGVELGAFVEVPLGPRKVLGVVWGPGDGGFERARLRKITAVLDVPPMREDLRQLVDRVAAYTITPRPSVLRLATRAPGIGGEQSRFKVYRLGPQQPDRMTDARTRVLAVLEEMEGLSFSLSELAEQAGVSSSVIKGLVKQGAVIEEELPRDRPFAPLEPGEGAVRLNAEQAFAAAKLREGIEARSYGATLLRGVTGAGKTEVYFEAIAACLAAGRQALVLLPEIALTAEFIERVRARFGAAPAEWHSGMTMAERRRTWKMVATNDAQLVVGARSALFLPFHDIGLIVVDEEHDGSYKQEDGVTYNARDMAVLRGSLNAAQVVLASATPSLESWANVEAGKYQRLDLTQRFGDAVMPEMRAVDMREEALPSGQWLSERLTDEIAQRIERGEQSLVFLNRRGYAPVTQCRACGQQIACRDCDARMVEHRFLKKLMCHQCGAERPMPEACPSCEAEGRLAAVGPGVERIAEEAQTRFPDARLAILSSDLFGSAKALKARIQEIADGEIDIIIGTQIVAKGHNFPKLTLVGVVDADLGLQGSDLRASERTFQLVRQVAGRAGRAEEKGLALLQSYQPDHPVIQAILSDDDEAFWRAEAMARQQAGMPPFGRMAGIVMSSPDPLMGIEVGNQLARNAAPLYEIGAEVYGPAPAPIARIRGRHRTRMLIKAEKGAPLQAALRAWIAPLKLPSNFRLTIDIDPMSFY